MAQKFVILDEARRRRVMQAAAEAEIGTVVTFKDGDPRSLDQNAALWAMLTDVSEQVEWYGKKLTSEEWKSVFTAGLKKTKVVPGLDGGWVVLGMSTSSMGKKEFSDLLELIAAFGSERGVKWSA